MKRSTLSAICLGALICLGFSNAFAADFKLCNTSTRDTDIIGFEVEMVGQRGFSKNWLKRSIRSGACENMNFSNRNHGCEIRYRVTFDDNRLAKGLTDICRTRMIKARN